jgi:hypothetical protein
MLQLTETTLFHWDLALEFLYNRFYNSKKEFSGPQTNVRKVQVWMSKMQPRAQPTGGSSVSACSYVSTPVNTNIATSTGFQLSVAPVISSSDRIKYCSLDVDTTSDSAYCNAVINQCEPTQQNPALVSDSPFFMQHRLITHLPLTRTSSMHSQCHLQMRPLKNFQGSPHLMEFILL